MAQCSECDRKAHAKGLCRKHYQAAQYKENPERFRAYARSKYERDAERIKKRSSDYYHHRRDKDATREAKRLWEKRNPEKKRTSAAMSRARRKEKIAAWARVYYAKNRDRYRIYGREYVRRNPDIVRAKTARRRARKCGVGGRYTKADVAWLFSQQKGKCAGCRCRLPRGYHVDHVVPLVAGGANSRGNLQLLCASCNASKGARPAEEFMRRRGYLL